MPIDSLPLIFVLALGLIVGSFLNAVIHRLPRGISLIRPGSRCPGCSSPIAWHDNVPVLGYLWLRGRCRKCKKPISIRYPVVELLTSLLFVAAYQRFGWGPLLFLHDLPFIAILVAVTFIDLDHRIIPDELSVGGLALGLASAWFVPGLGLLSSFIGAAVGFSIFYAFAWFYIKRTGRSGLGGGDIKLLAMIGAFVGPSGVFTTILISSVLGSVIGISWALSNRDKKVMTTAIPFGPFLVIGALYAYLLSEVLWSPFTIPT